MTMRSRIPGLSWKAVVLVALSLSIGWGVRGNWGHEYGAMIPGVLAALAAALVSGREDWRRRGVFFGFFGAIGWSFGGSMSYGRVLGYTHSDSMPDVLYGFAMVFVIGFLWGAIGGAGTALPAYLDRERLTDFFPPLIAVFAAWTLQDLFGAMQHPNVTDRLDWYDTDWLAALLAFLTVAGYSLVKRRVTTAASLILHMAAGWWVGFLALVVGLGLRMTPPRGDNWAGCLGMTAAMLYWLMRNKLAPVAWASLVAALFGGIGFSSGELIKLLGIATKVPANWHSVMEQSFGFISGVGIALAMGRLSTLAPVMVEEPPIRRWAEPFSVGFILLVVTFVNIRKNLESVWIPNKVVPESYYGLPAEWWFNLAYLALAAVVVALILRHMRESLAAMPATALGKGQALFVVFLWWIVIGNLSRYLPFHPVRMVTEGVIHLNACLATVLVLMGNGGWLRCPERSLRVAALPVTGSRIRKLALLTLAIALVAVAIQSAVTLAVFSGPAGNGQYRFGPRAMESR